MPRVGAEALEPNVRDHGPNAQRLAWEFDVQLVAHVAPAPVHADEIASAHGLLAVSGNDMSSHSVGVLLERRQLAAEMRTVAELREALAQDRFGQELRHHQRDEI